MIKLLLLGVVMGLSACAPLSSSTSSAIKNQQPISDDTFTIQVLGINDFHGQVLDVEKQGGMYELSRHLLHAIESTDEHSFVLHAGDHVGASPAESALLQDEPSIDFLNIVQQHCEQYRDNTCRVMGTTGNHEFDEGSQEMLRLLRGGNHPKGPFIHSHWQGANYETLSANVIDKASQQTILKPYSIAEVNGVQIGFIGIALDTTPELLIPGMVDDLSFLDQASTVTKISAELQAQGIEAIVVIVHDGTIATPYEGATHTDQSLPLDSPFGRFLTALPNAVDLVVSGHSHEFTNAYVKNSQGKSILVTQAFDRGMAYADISLTLSRQSKDVVKSSAEIVRVKANKQFDLTKSTQASLSKVRDIVSASSTFAWQRTQTLISHYTPDESEPSLGQFIAQSHKYALQADLGVMNDGGIRADLNAGEVTWGDVFAIQPFSNSLVVRRYSGRQLLGLFGAEYYWSAGTRLTNSGQLLVNGQLGDLDKLYTVAGNAFVMNIKGFVEGELVGIYGLDIDATIDYIKLLSSPFSLQDTPRSK